MKKTLLLILTLLFVGLVGFNFSSAFNTQLYYPNNFSSADYCTGKMSVGLFTSNTNGYYLTDFLSSNDYCNSIVGDNHNFIKDILVCARLLKSDRNQSSTATLVNNFVNNVRWNAWLDVNGNGVSINNYPCLFFKSGATPEIGFTTSMNFNNISGFNLGYSIYTLDNLNTLFNVSECSDQYTSLECQTEYNLIPIADVNQNYCEVNNLCPVLTGGAGTGVSWSALYINNIQYLGGPNIYVNIDEGLKWLYDNSDSNSFVIDVEGYNYDLEYLDDITTIQEYTPSSDDFTRLFTLFGPFSGLLVGLLFVILVFYFIKKLF